MNDVSRSIVVNSHANNTVALRRLLDSLAMCEGYEAADIIVVIGGCQQTSVMTHGNVTTARVDHNSIDFTGLIALLEVPDLRRPSYFYVHDTCEAGPHFIENVTRGTIDYDTASFVFHSMNMGVYSWRALDRHRDLVLSFKNPDLGPKAAARFKRLCVDHEDAVFRANKALGLHEFIDREDPMMDSVRDVYGTGVPRRLKYFPIVDLTKFAANWVRRDVYELRL